MLLLTVVVAVCRRPPGPLFRDERQVVEAVDTANDLGLVVHHLVEAHEERRLVLAPLLQRDRVLVELLAREVQVCPQPCGFVGGCQRLAQVVPMTVCWQGLATSAQWVLYSFRAAIWAQWLCCSQLFLLPVPFVGFGCPSSFSQHSRPLLW